MKAFIPCFLGFIMLQGIFPVNALVRRYRFEVMNSVHTRLCTTKTMLTVNGKFPGPTIYARRGDLVIVDVINSADQNITIHWHGVKMPRYPWADGTDFVTQCPITTGTKFTQRIILSNEEGTLWWHAHSDWSRATVHGAIVILPPKNEGYPFPKPHAQVPIILGEWWNDDLQKVLDDFIAAGRVVDFSDAFTINGQPGELYQCSTEDAFKLQVESGKTYLLRLVNAAMNFIMYFKIAGHNVTVVGYDAAYTKPLSTDYVAISPGQTVDLLLEANQPPGRYYMATQIYARVGNVPATGILEYAGSYTPAPAPAPPALPTFPEYSTSEEFAYFTNQFYNQLKSLANEKYPIQVPAKITETLFFTLSINEWPCNGSRCLEPDRLLASINNVSMLLPTAADILQAYYRGNNGVFTADFPDFPPSVYDFTQGDVSIDESRPRFGTAVKVLEYGAEVEIVLQSTIYHEIDHPVHLHGHNFFVVGSGIGNFDWSRDPANYNLVDPPLMETVAVPRNGWVTIRFKANNPGVWYMHCHLERHQTWGMKMAFIVKDGKASDEKMLPPPPDMPRCAAEEASDPLMISDSGKVTILIQ